MATAPATMEHEGAGGASAAEREGLNAWYLLAISGVVSAVIGILVLAYPDPSLKLLGVFLGIDLLIAGVLLILYDGDARTATVVMGTLALLAGVLVIRNPGKSIALLAIAFGLYLIVAGALTLGRVLGGGERRGIGAIHGLVALAVGIVIVAWPDVGLKTLTLLIGVALILQGAFELLEAFVLRAAAKVLRA
jgi:uncharacterized membrane protein HdeD (DUF308 family)